VITVIALLYAFVPDGSRDHWIFAVKATQVYLIMYVLMFIAAVRLRGKRPEHNRGHRAPALGLLCLVGTVSSVVALVVGVISPSQFGHLNRLHYALLLLLGGVLAIGIVPPLSCTDFASRRGRSPAARRPRALSSSAHLGS
jgi:glutamate:GABA antiporter